MTLTPAQRKMRARMAAHAMHAKHPDGREITRKAHEAFMDSFTSEAEKSEYFTRLNWVRWR